MHWYLVHTKPRQEKCALENLQRQGFQCYLPTLPAEKLRQGVLTVADEPLFPRYLFIRLGQGDSAKSWAPIRSTKGCKPPGQLWGRASQGGRLAGRSTSCARSVCSG